jgi:hypothetical protein
LVLLCCARGRCNQIAGDSTGAPNGGLRGSEALDIDPENWLSEEDFH